MLHQPSTSNVVPPRRSELGSSMVEYVGLGAVATMLISGLAAALDSTASDRVATAIIERLLMALSGTQ